jgi:1-acyl-sn-glycerol-3-phosphate acyltransferase
MATDGNGRAGASNGSQAPPAGLLQRALDDLREQVAARLPATLRSEDGAGVDWMELFDALRRRLSAVGMSERSGEVDEFGMDEVVLARFRPVLELLYERWWRVAATGLDGLPRGEPCLFVANRSGILPYDGLMIAEAVARHHPAGERPRFLVADWLITLPFAQSTLSRIGGVRACRENAERLLRAGRSVIAFPEGIKGAAKPFRDRYRLQRFGRGGTIRLALESGVPLIPVAVIGAEETHPVLFKIETLARAVGLPFVPVTPTFPWLGPLGLLPLPSKWEIRFGTPMLTEHLDRDAAADELLISRMTEELRTEIRRLIEVGLEARASVFS